MIEHPAPRGARHGERSRRADASATGRASHLCRPSTAGANARRPATSVRPESEPLPLCPRTRERAPSRTASALVLLWALGGLLAEAQARPRLPQRDLWRISQQGVVISYSLKVKGSDVRAGKAIGIVEASPEQVAAILLDVPNYFRFLHRVRSAHVVKRNGAVMTARLDADLPWPLSDAWALVTVRHQVLSGRVHKIHWEMFKGTLKRYRGYALIEPWSPRGEKVALTYRVLAVPNSAAPTSMISKGVRRLAEMVLHRVRLRAKALHKGPAASSTRATSAPPLADTSARGERPTSP